MTEASPPPTSPSTEADASDATAVATDGLGPVIDAAPGALVWVVEEEPQSLHADDPDNPSDIADWVQQGLLEGLFGVSASNAFYPELLAGEPVVEQLNSGTVVIDYRLRDGLVWSDGTPLTAADVRYTFDIIVEGCERESDRSIVDATNVDCEYDMGNRFGYELITDLEVVSDTEFTVTMAAFYGGWRQLFDRVFAAHAFGPTARDVNQNLRRWDTAEATALPSSGPLLFESWRPGEAIVLDRNEAYHSTTSPDATSQGPASVAGVHVAFVPAIDDRISLLLDGDAHIVFDRVDLEHAALTEAPGFTVAASAGTRYEQWSLNLLDPHLAKPEVREAIASTIDKEAMVATVYAPLFGDLLPAAGLGNVFWMPNQGPYQDQQAGFRGGPAAAGRLLGEAGYTRRSDGVWTHPDDGPLSLRVGTTAGIDIRDFELEVLVAQLGEAGFDITIDSAPGGQFFVDGPFSEDALAASASGGTRGDPDRWDIAQFSWTGGAWPGVVAGIFRSGSASNPYGFNSPEYDVAATDCNATLADAERDVCYNELGRFATTLDRGADGLFVIPLTQLPHYYGYTSSVAQGAVAPDAVAGGPLVNVVDFRLDG